MTTTVTTDEFYAESTIGECVEIAARRGGFSVEIYSPDLGGTSAQVSRKTLQDVAASATRWQSVAAGRLGRVTLGEGVVEAYDRAGRVIATARIGRTAESQLREWVKAL